MTSSPPAKRFDWNNLAIRVASATVLVPTVLGAIWYGGGPFLLMIAIAIGLLAIEWGKMSAPEAPAEVAVTITVAVLAAVFAAYVGWYRSAWLLMIGGGLLAAFITRHKADRAAASPAPWRGSAACAAHQARCGRRWSKSADAPSSRQGLESEPCRCRFDQCG